jgi:ATP-dependent helicase STH1/SNF2
MVKVNREGKTGDNICSLTLKLLLVEPTIKPSFTKAQLNTLRHQILAFKLISKNMPLPPHLQQAILSPIPQDTSYESTLPHDPSTTMNIEHSNHSNSNSNSKYIPDGTMQQHPQQQETAQNFNAYASPYVLLHRSTHTSSNRLRPHHQRFLVPSITPLGIDSYEIASERDRRVEARIRHRMNELKQALDNRDGLWSVQQQENDSHRRAAIELKSLRLLSKQKQVSRKKKKSKGSGGKD